MYDVSWLLFTGIYISHLGYQADLLKVGVLLLVPLL